MSTLSAWIQASRLLSQVNLVGPLVLGQVLAFMVTGRFSWALFAWLQAFVVANQLFVVFANDVADAPTDRDNRTFGPYSGGSRVLVEGKLTPRQLVVGAALAGAAMVAVAVVLALVFARPWALAAPLAAGALMWAYSFAPARLSYRGHGELLQGLGLGVVLPLLGFYGQAGSFEGMVWTALWPAFLLGVTGNILTSLPDHPSDLRAQKRSYAVRKGQFTARRHALELLALCALQTPLVVPGLPWWTYLPMVALPVGIGYAALGRLGSADAEQREECHTFVTLAAAVQQVIVLEWIVAALLSGLFTPPGG